jgi:hypothetical protein
VLDDLHPDELQSQDAEEEDDQPLQEEKTVLNDFVVGRLA